MTILVRLANVAGLDRTVFLIASGRVWSILAGLVSVWMIGVYLTPQLQGYYFTFASLIALQVLAELGLGQAIVHFASHEAAHLAWRVDGTLAGSPLHEQRLRSLLLLGAAWFAVAAVVMAGLLLPLGLHFFARTQESVPSGVPAAWTWLVLLSAANLFVAAALALLEGCGRVKEVAAARLAQAILGSAFLWSAFVLDGGLFALAAQAGGVWLAGAAWIVVAHRGFFRDLLARRGGGLAGLNWRREVWPFQWRIALSWISGFFIAQLFTPLLFATHGPVAAGQMGLALQIFGALNLVAMAWISAEVPLYGRMIALKQGAQLDRIFQSGLLRSTLALVLALAAAMGVFAVLEQRGLQFAQRLPSAGLMAVLAVVALANHVIYAEAALLRSHRVDPFMGLSLLSAAATGILAFAWIPQHGLAGAVAAYATVTLLVGLCGGSIVFLRKRKAWWLASPASGANAPGHA